MGLATNVVTFLVLSQAFHDVKDVKEPTAAPQ